MEATYVIDILGKADLKRHGESVSLPPVTDTVLGILLLGHEDSDSSLVRELCKRYTYYKSIEYEKDNAPFKNFEIIQVWRFNEKESANTVYLPWVVASFLENKDPTTDIAKILMITEYPALAILNQDGTLITNDGIWCVMNDERGQGFPWLPPTHSVDEIVGVKLQGLPNAKLKFPPPSFGVVKGVDPENRTYTVQLDSGSTREFRDYRLVNIIEDSVKQQQILFLKELWELTNGANWTNYKWEQYSWSSHPRRQLPGIETDAAGCIVAIRLNGCGLQGNIPDSIGQLHKILLIDFSDNCITGRIPNSLGCLKELRQLHLENNKLTEDIPHSLCQLRKLNQLFLSNNEELSGVIPDQLLNRCDLQVDYDGCEKLRTDLISIETPQFPMHVVSREALLNLERLVEFEEAVIESSEDKNDKDNSPVVDGKVRILCLGDSRELIFAPTFIREMFVFVSHRWLAENHPDDEANSKVKHLQKLARAHPSWNFFWIDFMCVPQRTESKKIKAINSLPHFVKCCGTVLTLCGNTDKSKLEIYKSRGWCRLEQLSSLVPFGDDSKLFVANKDEETIDQMTELTEQELNPLKGEYYQNNDKLQISKCLRKMNKYLADSSSSKLRRLAASITLSAEYQKYSGLINSEVHKKIISAFDYWQVFGDEFPSKFNFQKDCFVAILIGNPSTSHGIISNLAKVSGLFSHTLKVIYIPTGADSCITERTFTEKLPDSWIKITDETVINRIEGRMGVIKKPTIFVISGDCQKVIAENACRALLRREFGFPWSDIAIAKATLQEIEDFETVRYAGGLKYLQNACLLSHQTNSSENTTFLSSLLDNQLVGLYFSASWCGPSRKFTRKLKEIYSKLQSQGEKIEVIFISSDQDKESFESYFKIMPWLALDFNQREIEEKLSLGFEVNSIPTLIWVDPTTGEVNKKGAQTIRFGAEWFPWSPALLEKKKAEDKLFEESFKRSFETFKSNGGFSFLEKAKFVQGHSSDDLGDILEHLQNCELVGFFFSASWCGPSRTFTPKLVEAYHQLKSEGKNMEVILVSEEEDEESFQAYLHKVPWLVLDFSEERFNKMLSVVFGIRGIPTLVWANPKTGEFNKKGRETIDIGTRWFPWTAEMLQKKKEEDNIYKQQFEEECLRCGKVVIKDYRGQGKISPDYYLTFDGFNTFVGDIQLPKGKKYYYEIEVICIQGYAQIGWMTEGFESVDDPAGIGVGDDNFSWGFDGVRMLKWGNKAEESFGMQWSEGDILGCAADLEDMSLFFSVNGSFEAPNGLGFAGIVADWLSPALTASRSEYRVNFGDRPFKFQAPDQSYLTVHEVSTQLYSLAALQEQNSFSCTEPDTCPAFSAKEKVDGQCAYQYDRDFTDDRMTLNKAENKIVSCNQNTTNENVCPAFLEKQKSDHRTGNTVTVSRCPPGKESAFVVGNKENENHLLMGVTVDNETIAASASKIYEFHTASTKSIKSEEMKAAAPYSYGCCSWNLDMNDCCCS